MRKKWMLPTIAGVIILITGTLFAYHHRTDQAAEGNERIRVNAAAAISVRLLKVTNGSSPQWLEVIGAVRPEMESAIAARVQGRVMDVMVREGDTVRRGQPLIHLDARNMDASITEAQAGVLSAQVGYDSARVTSTMENALSEARIAEARAALNQADAAVAQSLSAQHSAEARYDQVKTGPRPQERRVASLAVAQAKSSVSLAKSNLQRMENLLHEGAISQQSYETAKSQYDVAEAQYESSMEAQSITDEGSRTEEIRQAEQAVNQARDAVRQSQANREMAQAALRKAKASALQANVRREEVHGAKAQIGQTQALLQIARVTRDYAAITAPFDGVVTDRIADPGAMASPGVPLLKVQGGVMRLEAIVPEQALRVIHKGVSVPLSLDAMPGRPITGRVTEIAPQGDTSSHTFIVKITLPPSSGARAGMFGRAHFVTGREARMSVPVTAVIDRQGLHYVFVADQDHTAHLRLITVGDTREGSVQVLSGLNPGENVIADQADRMTDGAKVQGD